MTLPRNITPGRTVLLSRRTLRRHFLLRPDPELNELVLYLVAYYARKFGMRVGAITVISDHYHIVLYDTHGQLPDFLRELNRVMALCIKDLRKWDGPVWEPGAVSVVELVTPQAAAQETVYTWLNAVRAGHPNRLGPLESASETSQSSRPTLRRLIGRTQPGSGPVRSGRVRSATIAIARAPGAA